MADSTTGSHYLWGNGLGEHTAVLTTTDPSNVPLPVPGDFNIFDIISDTGFGATAPQDLSVPPGYDALVSESTTGDAATLLQGNVWVYDPNPVGGPRDTITGGDGNDTMYGGANTGEIIGGTGSSVIYSGSLLEGGAPETILGGSGPTTVFGGTGDTIMGGSGPTTIYGGIGDQITAGTGPTTIYGGGGDTIQGGSGPETIKGGANDMIIGGSGPDTIYGAAGDTIQGGPGQSQITLVGGTQVLADFPGTPISTTQETVSGFAGGDTISFAGANPTTINQVVASAVTTSGNTLVTLPDGTRILLLGVAQVGAGFFS